MDQDRFRTWMEQIRDLCVKQADPETVEDISQREILDILDSVKGLLIIAMPHLEDEDREKALFMTRDIRQMALSLHQKLTGESHR